MAYSAHDFADESDVSRETFEDFKQWHGLLQKWNAKINLVSKSAVADFWHRHALDSWQLWAHVPEDALDFIDLGSGGGFPGLAMAIGCKHAGRGHVTMVESAGKKVSFLRTVIRDLDLPAEVKSERAENFKAQAYDVLTARAFAPLPELLGYAENFWGQHTQALLLKGQGASEEIDAARKKWAFDVDMTESRTDPEAVILKVQNLNQAIDI